MRDYVKALGWNEEPPAPRLTQEVIDGTTQRYLEAYRQVTGKELHYYATVKDLSKELGLCMRHLD